MTDTQALTVNSPIGVQKIDSAGPPVGVVRMDPEKSYAGVGELLQQYINDGNQKAWERITAKIDYTYESLDLALAPLASKTGLRADIASRTAKGQKLFFKPNLVVPSNIDPQTHGPDRGSTTCTEWPFVAALMRWFHDKLGVRYHQMALGEAATAVPAFAGQYSLLHAKDRPITPEAVIEGRSGDFYGGWGFYFVRKYLAGAPTTDPQDDPMQGFDESVSGTYIPPGETTDKLLVYDLNRIFDDRGKGRNVPVPDGVNFQSITLHKAVVGGDPAEPEDLRAYPGCILVNVPKLKVHNITLFTNVIKNLGIGLYPMQSAEESHPRWDYGVPHRHTPGIKGGIPHQVWDAVMDMDTGLPQRDSSGQTIVEKTGGITATMIDIIQAVKSQRIFMLHVVDAVEAINLDHTGNMPGTREPEGMVFAGLDPVATDLLSARYIFSNVSIREALGSKMGDGNGGYFPQQVPVPTLEEGQIVTESGYDNPLSRDVCFERAEQRGLGRRTYRVVGRDAVTDRPLTSVQGHLGTVHQGAFSELVTEALYYDAFKMPWDLQRTTFGYLEAVDQLAGSSLKSELLETFDETGDGIVTYEEFGKKGIFGQVLHSFGDSLSRVGTERFGHLSGPFIAGITSLKCAERSWNSASHDSLREYYWGQACLVAYRMSRMDTESPDLFLPGLTWGNGKWPSFELARYVYRGFSLFGAQFPGKVDFPSLYGFAFRYADLTQNEGRYLGPIRSQPHPEAIHEYIAAVSAGEKSALDFTFYVPEGYQSVGGLAVPHVEVTADPAKILTASFDGGREVWEQKIGHQNDAYVQSEV